MLGYSWLKNTAALNPDAAENGTIALNFLVIDNYAYMAPSTLNAVQTSTPSANVPEQWPGSANYCAHVGNSNFQMLMYDGRVRLYVWSTAKSLCKVQPST